MSIISILRINYIILNILRVNSRKRYLVNRDVIGIVRKGYSSTVELRYINRSLTKEEKEEVEYQRKFFNILLLY